MCFSNFNQTLVIDVWVMCYKITLRLVLLDLADDKSTLVQVINGLVIQTTGYYLSHVDPDQCRHMASLDHNVWPEEPCVIWK